MFLVVMKNHEPLLNSYILCIRNDFLNITIQNRITCNLAREKQTSNNIFTQFKRVNSTFSEGILDEVFSGTLL